MRYVDIFGPETWEANQYRTLARLNGHKIANQWADAMLGHGRTNYPVPAIPRCNWCGERQPLPGYAPAVCTFAGTGEWCPAMCCDFTDY